MKLNIILIVIFIVLTDVTTDILNPAFPVLKSYFNSTNHIVILSLSCNLIGFALSALIYGYIADIYGRRITTLFGINIFILSTILCIFANSMFVFVFARFIQGIGQGAAEIIGFSMVRHNYQGNNAAKIFSTINMCIALSPAFAPFVGGWILIYYSWQMIFIILLVFSIILALMLYYFFPKDNNTYNKSNDRFSPSVKHLLISYFNIISNNRFLFYIIILICSFTWLWNGIASIPFIFIEQYGLSPLGMGVATVIYAFFYIIGNFINQKLLNKYSRKDILSCIIYIPPLNCIFVYLCIYIYNPHPYVIEFIMFLEPISLAIIISNTMSEALDCIEKHNAARATALLVFLKLSAAAIMVFGMSTVFNVSFFNMVTITGCFSFFAALTFFLGKNKFHMD